MEEKKKKTDKGKGKEKKIRRGRRGGKVREDLGSEKKMINEKKEKKER